MITRVVQGFNKEELRVEKRGSLGHFTKGGQRYFRARGERTVSSVVSRRNWFQAQPSLRACINYGIRSIPGIDAVNVEAFMCKSTERRENLGK
jgi:hypothetical protein